MVSSKNRTILLDTSILFSIFEKKLPLVEHIIMEVGMASISVPESVINELKKMLNSKGVKRKLSKAVLEYLKKGNFNIVESEDKNNVDKDLLLLAKKMNAIVVTLDKELIKFLKENCIEVITWKNRRLRLL